MANVDTQKETFSTVTQVVYQAVFEGTEMFREISEQKAEERRAEEAAREQAAHEEAARERANAQNTKANAPSVIVDVQSTSADTATDTSTTTAATSAPQHAVNVLA